MAPHTTMQAVVQRGYGAPGQVLALDQVDRPMVGPDDVLVRMRATSVNTPDWLAVGGRPAILRLQFGLRRPKVAVRGSDVAGIVEAVGTNVTDLQPGEEVFGSLWTNSLNDGTGTFAEYTLAPAAGLIRKPAGLTFEEAAASVMSGLTALLTLREGGVAPGKRVLVNGASGGVGTFAVQIAKVLGAHVTGVCSTRNVEFVQSLGADHVIDYTKEDYTRGTQRYDVVLDNVLNHSPAVTAKVLSPNGTLISNSAGSGGRLLGGLPRVARAMLMGRFGSTDVRTVECVVNRDNLNALAALLASGEVKAIVEKAYPLSEAAGAVAHMMGHRARGNIAVVM